MDERTKRAMREKKINPPIGPHVQEYTQDDDGLLVQHITPGKTLLDEFAGMIATDGKTDWNSKDTDIAEDAYHYAAVMLLHRAEILGIELPE